MTHRSRFPADHLPKPGTVENIATHPTSHPEPIAQRRSASLPNPITSIGTLWRHRELLWQFTVRSVEMRHKGSMLGLAWSVLNPLLMLTLYVGVFGYIFGGKFGVVESESKWDYGLGIFIGLTLFHVVAESIMAAPALIATQPNFVKKVVFPLEVLPASCVCAAVVHMTISLMLVMIGALAAGRGLHTTMLLLPLVIASIVALSLGLAFLISALGVFFRDIGQIVGALATGLMFASAIFYPVTKIEGVAWAILRFNPLLHAVDISRDLVLWNRLPPMESWVSMTSISAVTFFAGFACFARLKNAFADVI